MLLTDDERSRFKNYLRVEAESNKAIIEQMAKMPGLEAVTKNKRNEVAALLIVIRMLEQTSSESIG